MIKLGCYFELSARAPMRQQAGWAVGVLLCLSPVLSSGEPIKIAVEFEGELRLSYICSCASAGLLDGDGMPLPRARYTCRLTAASSAPAHSRMHALQQGGWSCGIARRLRSFLRDVSRFHQTRPL